MHILTLGLNHTTAPVEVREKLAFDAPDQVQALAHLVGPCGLQEAAILSTCNRSEIYAAADGPDGLDRVQRFLAEARGVDLHGLRPCLYEYRDADAALHLFRVACGIDSLVIGESQILAQVRQTLERAQQQGSARLLLNELFQRSLHVGKRARTETDIGRGHLSISTAAVELAGQIFDRLENCQALLLGAGEMGELTAQYLMEAGVQRLRVANRTHERAVELAGRFQGQAVSFEQLAEQLETVDIVVSSTASPGFVIQPEAVDRAMRRRRDRPLFLIDIAVPRDIDPQVRQHDNVYLFDIDDLEQVVQSHRQEREQEIRKVQALIEEEMGAFLHWLNALGAGPLIRSLRSRAQELRQAEVDRWMGKLAHLTEQDRQTVEALLRGYENKLLHQPLVQIKEFAGEADGYLRLDTVRRLFALDPGQTADGQVEP